ncbi:MAG: MBL fold metallo-hydrolase [Myxococcota bacterium]|nr:MBL fold metallo-hydrolase [Myxococcota bacterium]
MKTVLKGLAAIFLLLLTVIIAQGYTAFGTSPDEFRMAKLSKESLYSDSTFENPEPLYNDWILMIQKSFSKGQFPEPSEPIKPMYGPEFGTSTSTSYRATWLGHSTVLIEIENKVFLTDPVWSERCSPVPWLGPKRWYMPPIAVEHLPKLTAVVISHDHYDHLDYKTILSLNELRATFVVPLGVAAHLRYWGVSASRIRELDWWQTTEFEGVEVISTPARHASGRHLLDRDRTLWSGYVIRGSKHRVYFSGDTGLFTEMQEIGKRYGPFDLTMIEVGAYDQAWPDWHIGPEQAVIAHQWLRGNALLPIHWGLFDLALHNWTEPIERTLLAGQQEGVLVLTPKPGQPIDQTTTSLPRWWPEIKWQTKDKNPVNSTKVIFPK